MDVGIIYHLICLLTFTSASCPDGSEFFEARGLCFKLFTNTKAYTGADTACRDESGILARIKDSAIQQFIEDKYIGKYFWIGLEDDDNNGVYKWADQSSVIFNNWDTTPSSGKCGEYNTDGGWIDIACSSTMYYLCELPTVQELTRGIFYHRLFTTDLSDSSAFKSFSVQNYVKCVQLCRLYHELCLKITFNMTQIHTDQCVLYTRTYGSSIIVDSSVLIYSLL